MSLITRIRNFFASPQGRRMATDPRNRQRARSLLARFRGRR